METASRQKWVSHVRQLRTTFGAWLQARYQPALRRKANTLQFITQSAEMLKAGAIRHRRAILASLAILSTPPLAAHFLLPPPALEPYNDVAPTASPVIVALLSGERLVPPPPLPPELFISRDVDAEKRQLGTASREWSQLDSDFRQRLLALYKLMEGRGYRMALLEGYRSPERQAQLAQLGRHVTYAGPNQSYHQFGLAADSAFYRDGRIVISERDPWAMEGYRLYGQFAESLGLTWGGNWQLMDFGHVELRKRSLVAAGASKPSTSAKP